MRTNRFLWLTSILALAGLLAGCAGVPRTNDAIQYSYTPSMLNDVAKRGGMPLVVRGEPFPDQEGRFAEVAAGILTETHRGPEFEVFPDGTRTSSNNPWRTVMVVNPRGGVAASNVCSGDVTGSTVENGEMRVIAAFCLGDRAKTTVRGWASNATGAGSQVVASLLRQTGLALYPLLDEDRDRDSPGGDFDI